MNMVPLRNLISYKFTDAQLRWVFSPQARETTSELIKKGGAHLEGVVKPS